MITTFGNYSIKPFIQEKSGFQADEGVEVDGGTFEPLLLELEGSTGSSSVCKNTTAFL